MHGLKLIPVRKRGPWWQYTTVFALLRSLFFVFIWDLFTHRLKVSSLVLGWSHDRPTASEVTLAAMDTIDPNTNHDKARTVCITLVIYCMRYSVYRGDTWPSLYIIYGDVMLIWSAMGGTCFTLKMKPAQNIATWFTFLMRLPFYCFYDTLRIRIAMTLFDVHLVVFWDVIKLFILHETIGKPIVKI